MQEPSHPYEPLGTPPTPPPPSRPRWRVPKVAVAVGVTAFLGLGGAGLAFAVGGTGSSGSSPSSSPASSPSSTPSSPVTPKTGHPGFGPGGRFGRGFAAGLGGNVVHGEYTVKNGSSYQTVAVQVGQVTGVSPTSITVKSSDGYTQTYVVQSSTIVDSQSGGISAVQDSDNVNIQSLVQGSKHTATDIVDTTKIGASRKGFGFGSDGPGRKFEPPAPSGTPDSGASTSEA